MGRNASVVVKYCCYAIGGKPKEQCKIENNVCVGSLAEGHKECWEAK